MSDCPHCHQAVNPDAIACPYCRTALKAFGHPGIPLYQAPGAEALCKTCVYDADNSCNYPQRPEARNCTMYQKIGAAPPRRSTAKIRSARPFTGWAWWRQNPAWLWLGGLFLVIFLVKLAGALR
jgi:hypothetical protein